MNYEPLLEDKQLDFLESLAIAAIAIAIAVLAVVLVNQPGVQ